MLLGNWQLLDVFTKFYVFTSVSQKFCNILVHPNLQCVYPVTKAVQAKETVPTIVSSIKVGSILTLWLPSQLGL